MGVRLPIGDFSRMTHLSVKALRHYHEVGLLEPAQIDPYSGYRFYVPAQLPAAQVIRRFRDLGMPLDEIRAVLEAPDVEARNAVIVAYMQRMEAQLAATQATVTSLRSLLERPASGPIAVEHRSAAPVRAMAISEQVPWADLEQWWAEAFTELDATLQAAGVTAAGPRAALFTAEVFEQESGEVTALVPIAKAVPDRGRVHDYEAPGAELAVAVHRGALADIDQTYAALGTYVAEREIGVGGPIWEVYLVTSLDTDDETAHRIEVCWPVFHAK